MSKNIESPRDAAAHHQEQHRLTVASLRHTRLAKLLTTLCAAAALSACKLEIQVPPGGEVRSTSGAYFCGAQDTCTLDVYDLFFDETFVAVPKEGFRFKKWRKNPGALCGDSYEQCRLGTRAFEGRAKLLSILESDQVFRLLPVFEPVPKLKENQFTPTGGRVDVPGGFNVSGRLVLDSSGELDQVFENSDLQLRFNAGGDLNTITGTALMPAALSDHVGIESNVRAEVGFFSGREINNDETYEIDLLDERKYLVFLMDRSVDINLTNPGNPGSSERLKISTPASGKVVMIADPSDQMSYVYGESGAVGAEGRATSQRGLLPFIPDIKYPGISRFEGHSYRTGKFDLGIKAVDLLSLEGALITHEPGFRDINLKDPLNSDIQYHAGFNGSAKLILSIFSFGLFEMDMLEASARFGATRSGGNMSLASELEPDLQKLPSWMPIKAGSRINVGMRATSKGEATLDMGGRYVSNLPPADIEGSIRMTRESVTLSGQVVDPRITLPVSITFRDRSTHARIGLDLDFQNEIVSNLDYAFDEVEDEVSSAIAELENAVGDYELELSLNGLREALPGIVDFATNQLNGIPGKVYSEVRSRVKSEINKNNVCFIVCAVSGSLRDSIATKAANTARDRARSEIKSYLAMLANLKALANTADNEHFTTAIEAALRLAYDNRTVTRKVSVKVGVPKLFTRTFSETFTVKVLDSATASKILQAANNVHRIPETGGLVISAQEIVDRLPTEEILAQVRRQVEDGLSDIPGLSSVEYQVVNGDYSARVVFSDGSAYGVDFNVLDPGTAIAGISDLLANHLLDVL